MTRIDNTTTQTGFVTNIRTRGNKVSFGLSIGVKQQDGSYENGFLEVQGSSSVLQVNKGDKVTIKGFLSFEFWNDKTTGNKRNKIVLVAKEVLNQENSSYKPQTQQTEQQHTTVANQEQYVPEYEEKEVIPF